MPGAFARIARCRAALLALALASAAPAGWASAQTSPTAPVARPERPVSVNMRIMQLAAQVRRHTEEAWRDVATAPAETLRLREAWGAARSNGEMLRAVVYGLILLMIGGGVEWLYWCYAARARRALAELAVAGGDDPLPPRRAAALALRRAAIEAGGAGLFAATTIGASDRKSVV